MNKQPVPPKMGIVILRWIYDEERANEVAGDLFEIYIDRVESQGRFKANVQYLIDVLLSFRNFDLKKRQKNESINTLAMFKNLLKISIRSLVKRRSYSILNILGLSVSLAFAFLLWMYIRDQDSYDLQFEDAERIYRVNSDFNMNGKRDIYSNAPQPVAKALVTDYPEVVEATRLAGVGGLEVHRGILEVDDRKIISNALYGADSNVNRIFNREFVAGHSRGALDQPNSIVVSEAIAVRLFGTTDVLGKNVNLPSHKKLLVVTGVMKDDLRNTHIPMDAIISWSTFPGWDSDWWYGAHVYTYIKLNENNNIAALRAKIPSFYNKHMKKTLDEFHGTGDLLFQPLRDIYLSEEYLWEPSPHGSRTNIMALTIVMILLLGFACVNYVNLATAFAADRASEIGIRKVLGSSRLFLAMQFLGESVLLSMTAGVLAVIISWMALPYFNSLTDLDFTVQQMMTPGTAGVILLAALILGLAAGIFPAMYLSSIESLKVLKGKFSIAGGGERLRRLLVTCQYFIAALLITGIVVVSQQTRFIKMRDVGFDRENLLEVNAPDDSLVWQHIEAFTAKLQSSPHVSGATRMPLEFHRSANSFAPILRNPDGTTFQMGSDLMWIDSDFISAVGAQLVQGRNFIKDSAADEDGCIIINEAAVKKFGWADNPLGGELAGFTADEPGKFRVIGIVKDFNMGVSYQLNQPMILFLNTSDGKNIFIRFRPNEVSAGLDDLKEIWHSFYPNHQIEYSFVSESLNAMYNKEEKFLSLLATISVIILFIAFLGIVGLVSYTTRQRKKEIAIRKVLGSPLQAIVLLLSRKFMILLIVGNLVAIPVSYYLITQWLQNFAIRIEPGLLPFTVSFLACMILTAGSLLYHTRSAALANPVDALGSE